MRLAPLKVFAAVFVLSAAGLLSAAARAVDDPTLRDISRYREWKRVTQEPRKVGFASPGG